MYSGVPTAIPAPVSVLRLRGHAHVRDAEIGQQRVIVGEQDVLRLHIAVHEPVAVRVVQASADLCV